MQEYYHDKAGRKWLNPDYAKVKQLQQTCSHIFLTPSVTGYVFYWQQCTKCKLVNKLKKGIEYELK